MMEPLKEISLEGTGRKGEWEGRRTGKGRDEGLESGRMEWKAEREREGVRRGRAGRRKREGEKY